LLLQVIFHSRIAEESGHFDIDEVVENIVEKMIRRHPHVFGKKGNQAGKIQLEDWEALKKQERTERARSKGVVDPSILDDVALAFPALMRAEKLLERAAKSGFKWLEIDSIFNKINEEIEEFKIELDGDSISQQKIQEEIGDILLTVVSLARHLKVDPETALRCGNNKFEKRFRFIEKRLVKEKKNLEDTNLEEFELLWQESKLKKKLF